MDKMNITAGESKRSKNFKDVEVDVLLSLVKDHKQILENKQTDQVTLKDKEKAWISIEKEFNQVSGVYFRDWKTLKSKYENLKKTSKRKWADDKKFVLGTGGGPSKPSTITQTDFKIKELLGDLQTIGKKSLFDSDAEEYRDDGNIDFSKLPIVFEEEVDRPSQLYDHSYAVEEENNIGLLEIETEPKPTSSGNFNVKDSPKKASTNPNTWPKPNLSAFDSQFTIKKLQSKSSSPLQVKKKRVSPLDNTVAGKKIEIMAKTKQDLFELQKSLVENQILHDEEQHRLKMKFLEEEHRKKMILLDLQIKNQELKMKKHRAELTFSNP